MAYADLLDNEGINSQYLAILKPKIRVENFSLYSGSVYRKSFDYGTISKVEIDGVELTEAASSSLSAGYWYYDYTNEYLYVRTSDSSTPNDNFVVATYEIYASTFDAHWYRVPTDNTTRVVYFDPIINNSPSIKYTISDNLFGYSPIQTSSITLNNAEHTLEKHLYYSSYSKAEIYLYHWLGDLEVANLKLVIKGIMSDQHYDGDSVTIDILSRLDILDKEYRNAGTDASFFSLTDFPSLDEQYVGAPIRKVYGYIEDGFTPVNVDYVLDNPTTSDNRIWVAFSGQSNIGEVSTTVPAAPASSVTRTYVQPGAAVGIQVGDSVWINGATDRFVIVTAVDASFNYFDHAATGGAASTGDTVTRSPIGFVKIVQDNITYTALYGRDYTSGNLAVGTFGFTFDASMEANLSLPRTLSPADKVFCRVYGKKNVVTINGGSFGGNDSYTNNLTQPTVILFDLMKTNLGLTESEINLTSFTTARTATSTEAVGFAIPETIGDSFPKYKELFLNILNTQLAKLYIDNDLKWTIELVAPYSVEDKSIDDTEILKNSFNMDFSYGDLVSDVIVEYNIKEQDETSSTPKPNKVTYESDTAKYLHGVKKQQSFKSYHFREADAQSLCDHIGYILGDRKGTVTFKTKNRFYDTLLNDVVEISRTKQPGFTYDQDVEQVRQSQVITISKNLKNVTITLDDSKGMNDNTGSW